MIRPGVPRITKKEKIRQRGLKVFGMVQKGKEKKQIASALGVTQTTVTNDINGLLQRLEAEKLSGTVVDPGAMRALRSYVRKMPSPASPRQFSDRQKKIADRRGRVFEELLMGQGRTEIARDLGVSKHIPIHDTNVLMQLALEKTPPGVKLDPRLIDALRDKFSDRQRKIADRRGRVFEGLLMGYGRAEIARKLGVSKDTSIGDTNVLMRLAFEKTPPGVKLDPRLIDALRDKFSDRQKKIADRRGRVFEGLLMGGKRAKIAERLGVSKQIPIYDTNVLMQLALEKTPPGVKLDPRLIDALAISAKTTKRRAEVRKRLLAGEGQSKIRRSLRISRALVSLDVRKLRQQAEARVQQGKGTDTDRQLIKVLNEMGVSYRKGRILEELLMGQGRTEIARDLGVTKSRVTKDIIELRRLASAEPPPGARPTDPRIIEALTPKAVIRRGQVLKRLLAGERQSKIRISLGIPYANRAVISDDVRVLRLKAERRVSKRIATADDLRLLELLKKRRK